MGYGERMRVLITRPEREAMALAQALGQRGHVAVIAPLFQLHFRRPPDDFAAALAASQAVLLTSANGARALAEASEQRSKPILAVGDMTAATAEGLGFTSVASASGDNTALAKLAEERLDPKAGPLIHVSGVDVAGEPAPQDIVRRFALYEAREVEALPDSARAALEARALDAATFFSPRASGTFVKLVTGAGLADTCRAITAIAISPAAAEPLKALPFKATLAAARPTRQAVLDEIDRLAVAIEEPQSEEPAPLVETAEPARPTMSDTSSPPPLTLSSPLPESGEPPAPPPAPPIPTRRGLGVFGAFVTGLVASAIVLAAALLSLPYWPDEARAMWRGPASQVANTPVPPAPTVDVAAQVDAAKQALSARIDDLDKRVRAVANTVTQLPTQTPTPPPTSAPAPSDEALNGLKNRIEALENKPPPPPAAEPAAPNNAEIDKVAQETAALRMEIATLRSGLQNLDQAVSGQKDQSKALAEAVEKTKAESSRMGAEEKKATAAARASAVIGIAARLNAALEAERPFASDLALLGPLAQDDKTIAEQSAALQPLADKGVASRAGLTNDFPAMARTAMADDLADDSFGERVLGRLKALVSLRRVGSDVQGDTVEAKLARAEAALKAGDLAQAVDLVKSLPEPTHRATSSWLARADAHLTAQRAIDRLAAEGVALLSAAR
ncbi:MAG: uroporphyrinogen-III synthase [Alphaproteobacteria bacterium]|nr:uroporphyrinogen-III synthase [Alphaproteobacteria bacterium]